MAFKKPPPKGTVPDSPDKLFLDLPRRRYPSLFDHQGQLLRRYATDAQDMSDVALQLPTGSGKTLVGLLLAEWRRRKNQERVVYLCPTRQLVNQVAEEATSKYGLNVETFTGSIREYTPEAKASYSAADKVAITTYSALFNTNPFFRNPDVIIVDDAHAAENYMAQLWSVHFSRFDEKDGPRFNGVASALGPLLSPTNFARLTSSWESLADKLWVDKIPTLKLKEHADELRAAVSANVRDSEQQYAWQMLEPHLEACQLYVSSSEILIRPLIPPTWSHRPFENAKQRVFMSATLGAGGDLERLTGRSKIHRLPIPDGWDRQGIGRRFFIFPGLSLDEDENAKLRRHLMRIAKRSLVLAPSFESAGKIEKEVKHHLKCPTFTGDQLESGRSQFVAEERAVAVVANRYDGIDLPNEDCRLLFVEGLPKATNLQERFLMNRMGAQLLYNERVQTRVLQAVGRCTRGLNDYSAVVVNGDELTDYLIDKNRRKYLHPELQAELEFGENQSKEIDLEELEENFKIFLRHDQEWEEANEQILEYRANAVQESFPAMDRLAAAVPHEVEFQKALWRADYPDAFEHAREVLGTLTGEGLRGYRALWHYLAGSAADLGALEGISGLESNAREQFRLAKHYASGIPWIASLAAVKIDTREPDQDTPSLLQVEQLENNFTRLGLAHNRNFAEREREIRDGLASAEDFEAAQMLLGEHLGFMAGKRETDAAPDPWWMIGDICLVFEDHAGAAAAAYVDAKKARQAASHPAWIKENVPGAAQARIKAVLVTPTTTAKEGAIPSLRDVAYWSLSDFRAWSEQALTCIREIRRTFAEPGDLSWRANAITALNAVGASASALFARLSQTSAADSMRIIS
jgi:Rad3-related DNA helicase